MTRPYRQVGFRDELLADGSVRRAYADGRQEWRRRTEAPGSGTVVTWRDDRGRSGADELLGRRIIKRRIEPDTVVYGRDVGYGRTTWSDGVLTVNETSLGGRAALIIAGIGAAGLMPALVDPPTALAAEEEEALRQQQMAGAGSGGSGGGGDGSSDADWSGSDPDSGDDFG